MKSQEAIDKINAYGAQLTKIGGEIQTLKDLIANRDDVPDDVAAAINGLGANIQAVDDLNPDTVITP